MTVTDPGASPNLSDVSKQRVNGSRQIILDRDLQLVVNSLWASGAEAISVGGVRIGPNVTIRQAGGAILVDNNPTSSPYTILAVGPPHAMQDVFDNSPGLQRLRLLEASYGVGVDRERRRRSLAARRGGPRCQVRQTDWAVVRNRTQTRIDRLAEMQTGNRDDRYRGAGDRHRAGLGLPSRVPEVVQPYLPIAVVAALDAVFGGLRAYLERIFDPKVFVVSFVFNVLVAALIVYVGDQLGVGTQLSTAIIVVLGIRIFGNAAALRRRLFGA